MSPLTAYVIETVVTLLGVIALAIAVLYGARRMGVGRPSGPLQLVGRLPLDGRRAVYLVKVGDVVYVVGASEAGLNKLGQLSGDGIDLGAAEQPRGRFAEALARAISGARADRKPAPPPDPAENDAA